MSYGYVFSKATGELLSALVMNESNNPTVRDDITDVAPPAGVAGYVPVWNGSDWTNVVDQRGTSYVDVDGNDRIWDQLGVAPSSSPNGLLVQAKAKKLAEIKAARDAAEYGPFTWDGSVFDGDAVSTGRIMGAFSLALAALMNGQPYSQEWVLEDNTTRTLSATDMVAVGATKGALVAAAFSTAVSLRAQIEAATSVADVEAITWPT